jgi:hypothetical protein
LVDEKGEFVDYFLPITQPDSKRITSKLKWYITYLKFFTALRTMSVCTCCSFEYAC